MAVFAGGLAAVVLGIIGIIAWWNQFILILMGSIPAMLILGGGLAAYLGFEEIKDKRNSEALDDTSSALKQEVESLKEELRELKQEKNPSEGE